jgi:hypothetical protein
MENTMDLAALSQATNWHSALKDAERCIDSLAEYRVVGIVVDRGEGGLSPIRIERGGNSGTGRITSIGWSKDLEQELTNAMHAVFEARATTAREALTALGVKAA